MKFQDVLMNCNDDLENLKFDQNDMKVIEQNNQSSESNGAEASSSINLSESIFLRYLPLPMIIKTLQDPELIRDQQTEGSFLKIFQQERYEQATLIWNREMRE